MKELIQEIIKIMSFLFENKRSCTIDASFNVLLIQCFALLMAQEAVRSTDRAELELLLLY